MSTQSAAHRPYVAQQSTDLTLSLYEGAFPAEAVWVLAETNACVGAWSIRAQVVGASHVVVVTCGGTSLTEAMVARPVHAGAPDPIRAMAALDAREVLLDTGEWIYTQEVRRLPWIPGELAALDRAQSVASPDRVSASYAADAEGRMGLTALAWRAEGAGLRLETFHVYPDEEAVVATVARCRKR